MTFVKDFQAHPDPVEAWNNLANVYRLSPTAIWVEESTFRRRCYGCADAIVHKEPYIGMKHVLRARLEDIGMVTVTAHHIGCEPKYRGTRVRDQVLYSLQVRIDNVLRKYYRDRDERL